MTSTCCKSLYRSTIVLITFVLVVCHLLMICAGIGNILCLFVFANKFSNCDARIYIWLIFQSILYVINIKTNKVLLILFQLIVYIFGWMIIATFTCSELIYLNNLIFFQQVLLTVMLISILIVIFFTLVEIGVKGFEEGCNSEVSLAWIAITKFKWLKSINKIKNIYINHNHNNNYNQV